MSENKDAPKVVATDADAAGAEQARAKAESKAQAASLRGGHVAGLQNELAYLERQPTVNATRVAAVKAELDRYAEKPSQRRQEAAVPPGAGSPVPGATAPAVAPEAAAKKAARKAPARKAPAKKTAAKK